MMSAVKLSFSLAIFLMLFQSSGYTREDEFVVIHQEFTLLKNKFSPEKTALFKGRFDGNIEITSHDEFSCELGIRQGSQYLVKEEEQQKSSREQKYQLEGKGEIELNCFIPTIFQLEESTLDVKYSIKRKNYYYIQFNEFELSNSKEELEQLEQTQSLIRNRKYSDILKMKDAKDFIRLNQKFSIPVNDKNTSISKINKGELILFQAYSDNFLLVDKLAGGAKFNYAGERNSAGSYKNLELSNKWSLVCGEEASEQEDTYYNLIYSGDKDGIEKSYLQDKKNSIELGCRINQPRKQNLSGAVGFFDIKISILNIEALKERVEKKIQETKNLVKSLEKEKQDAIDIRFNEERERMEKIISQLKEINTYHAWDRPQNLCFDIIPSQLYDFKEQYVIKNKISEYCSAAILLNDKQYAFVCSNSIEGELVFVDGNEKLIKKSTSYLEPSDTRLIHFQDKILFRDSKSRIRVYSTSEEEFLPSLNKDGARISHPHIFNEHLILFGRKTDYPNIAFNTVSVYDKDLNLIKEASFQGNDMTNTVEVDNNLYFFTSHGDMYQLNKEFELFHKGSFMENSKHPKVEYDRYRIQESNNVLSLTYHSEENALIYGTKFGELRKLSLDTLKDEFLFQVPRTLQSSERAIYYPPLVLDSGNIFLTAGLTGFILNPKGVIEKRFKLTHSSLVEGDEQEEYFIGGFERVYSPAHFIELNSEKLIWISYGGGYQLRRQNAELIFHHDTPKSVNTSSAINAFKEDTIFYGASNGFYKTRLDFQKKKPIIPTLYEKEKACE